MGSFRAEEVRKDFPQLAKSMHGRPLIYLDSAATSLKPQTVIDVITKFYAEEYGTVHRAVYELAAKATERYSSVREKIRSFLNAASSDEIIFTKGTTDGINLVAASYGKTFLESGDEIIITEAEHHSNIVPWQLLAKEKNLVLKFIPISDIGELDLSEFQKLITSRTKLISLAHISNVTGSINPIEEIIATAHQRGAKVLIDGAQSAPHMPVDVQHLDADFFVFSGHKLFGPTGVGVLYGKKELLSAMPPYQGGGDMIDTVTIQSSTYQDPPLRFEAGTPMIAEVIALGEAIDYLETLGRQNVAGWEHTLLLHATEKLQEIDGLRIIGTSFRKGAIISFSLKNAHPLDIGTMLDLKGIAVRTGHLCTQPLMKRFGVSALTRVSFGPYNTLNDVDVFVKALQEVLKLL